MKAFKDEIIQLYSDYFEQNDKQFPLSRLVFNLWDFGINNNMQKQQIIYKQANFANSMINYQIIMDQVNKRTKREWRNLYIRRTCLLILNLIMVIALSYLIVLATTN